MYRGDGTRFINTTVTLVVVVLVAGGVLGRARARTPQGQEGGGSQSVGSGQKGKCATKHDRFRNRTTTTLAASTILRTDAEELRLGFSTSVEGEPGSPPREVELLFDSTTDRLRYGNSAEVRFIVDGVRVDGGTAYKTGGSAMRQVNERLRLTMPAGRFLDVAAGRRVEMQIGETEVLLEDAGLERFREFASCAGLRPGEKGK